MKDIADAIPRLRPPLDELPPAFWDQHGNSVLLFAVVLLAGIAFVAWRITRPRSVVVIAPDILARQALEALHDRPEDSALASEVGHHLRRFTQAVMELPLDEATTEQLLARLQHHERISALAWEHLAQVLKECDKLAFAPVRSNSSISLVTRALSVAGELDSLRKPKLAQA